MEKYRRLRLGADVREVKLAIADQARVQLVGVDRLRILAVKPDSASGERVIWMMSSGSFTGKEWTIPCFLSSNPSFPTSGSGMGKEICHKHSILVDGDGNAEGFPADRDFIELFELVTDAEDRDRMGLDVDIEEQITAVAESDIGRAGRRIIGIGEYRCWNNGQPQGGNRHLLFSVDV